MSILFVLVLTLMLGFATVACIKQHLSWKRDSAAESKRRKAIIEDLEPIRGRWDS